MFAREGPPYVKVGKGGRGVGGVIGLFEALEPKWPRGID